MDGRASPRGQQLLPVLWEHPELPAVCPGKVSKGFSHRVTGAVLVGVGQREAEGRSSLVCFLHIHISQRKHYQGALWDREYELL